MTKPIGERVASMETLLDTMKDDIEAVEKAVVEVGDKLSDLEKKIDRLMYLGLTFAVTAGVINEKTLDIFHRITTGG